MPVTSYHTNTFFLQPFTNTIEGTALNSGLNPTLVRSMQSELGTVYTMLYYVGTLTVESHLKVATALQIIRRTSPATNSILTMTPQSLLV